ncbi:MAG: hypothetical protein WBG38_14415 [Nodosilinea sp.]
MTAIRVQARRTAASGPPPNLLFGELAYSDGDRQLYVGRPDSISPTIFQSDLSPIYNAIAALQAQVNSLSAVLPVVGSIIYLPYLVTLNAGLWTSPQGLIYYAPHGNTIGSPTSGATVGNAIMQQLYQALWGHLGAGTAGWGLQSAAGATVARGADAAADWAANRRLVVPDFRGRAIVMAGQGSALTNRVVGSAGGAEVHSLNASENGPHDHALRFADQPINISAPGSSLEINKEGPFTAPNFRTGMAGFGTPHNNMQPWAAMTQLWFVGGTP